MAEQSDSTIQIVNVPGLGPIDYPNAMPDDEIVADINRRLAALNGVEQPPAKGLLDRTPPEEQTSFGDVYNFAKEIPSAVLSTMADYAIGAGKGLVSTASGIGNMLNEHMGHWGGSHDPERFAGAAEFAEPSNPVQAAGKGLEQAAEFAVFPEGQALKVGKWANRAANIGKRAVTGAGLAKLQGGSDSSAAATGLLNAIPLAGIWNKTLAGIRGGAKVAVRSGVKPIMREMDSLPNSASPNQNAEDLVDWIINNKVTDRETAAKIIRNSADEMEEVYKQMDPLTDAAGRATLYLDALEEEAKRQALPAADVAQIRNVVAGLLEGPLGKDVVTMKWKPHPTLLDAGGKPYMVRTPETSRALRTDITTSESMEIARATDKWSKGKWGEHTTAQTEASKRVQSALRDEAKEKNPALKPLLAEQGKAMDARQAFAVQEFLMGNRDPKLISIMGTALAETMRNRPPAFTTAHGLSSMFANTRIKAGVNSTHFIRAIAGKDWEKAADILRRLTASRAVDEKAKK